MISLCLYENHIRIGAIEDTTTCGAALTNALQQRY
jgi:hypothetical protein